MKDGLAEGSGFYVRGFRGLGYGVHDHAKHGSELDASRFEALASAPPSPTRSDFPASISKAWHQAEAFRF